MKNYLKVILIIALILLALVAALRLPKQKDKARGEERQEVIESMLKKQEVIESMLKKQECLSANWKEYTRLWNEDCKALNRQYDCTLTLYLSQIIEEKIGCK